jgi:hypothetical protein
LPFELSGIFNFLPFHTINPYVSIGGGGAYWEAENNTGRLSDGFDAFLKAGAGLELRTSNSFAVHLAATWRFSFTDGLDDMWLGDENDQVLDVQAGLTYYFDRGSMDRDHDAVRDDLDLMPDIAEDRDGYLDHDGVPETNPALLAVDGITDVRYAAPIVMHEIVDKVTAGRTVAIHAEVHAAKRLNTVATLYRPAGASNWSVMPMQERAANLYYAEIPAYAVIDAGFQYFVVAVDETLSGVGFSGLPSRPVTVAAYPDGTPFRTIGAIIGGLAAGTATFVILRKQD